ncbi:MAG TPA: glutaredoxin domain-containing protein [Sporichthya sp.]|jgi:mycoredoxin|nr:glutaredoxin domain-containing protein [Sporichthya sp.]
MADYASQLDTDAVVMFSTAWCGYCKRLKLLMQSAGIPFVEVDIEADPAAEEFVLRANGDGTATVPTLRFPDGSTAVNPTFAEVKDRVAAIA